MSRAWLLFMGILIARGVVVAWTDPSNISNTSKASNYPAITVDDQERVHVTWAEDYFEVSKIFYACLDGDIWSTPIDVSRNDIHTCFYRSSVEVDNRGRVHVVWNYNSFDLMWTYCDGDTWSIPANVSNTPRLSAGPRTTADDSGRIHLVWHDESSGKPEIYYSMYDGESWQGPQRITNSPGEEHCFWPDITRDSNGYLHVVWTHYGGGGSDDYWIQYSKYDGSSWSSPLDILKLGGEHITNSRIGMDSQDHPHLVAERWLGRAIYYTHYDGNGTAWATPYLVYEGSHARRPDIAIDICSGTGCVVWGDRYYRFFQDTTWDSVSCIAGPDGVAPALVVGRGTFHLVWAATGDIYYSGHRLTGIESQEEPTPKGFNLDQNFPNPFIGKTVISYQIPEDSWVTLIISNPLGMVIEKAHLGYRLAGDYNVPILSSSFEKEGGAYVGIYFYTIKAGNFAQTRKMVVVH